MKRTLLIILPLLALLLIGAYLALSNSKDSSPAKVKVLMVQDTEDLNFFIDFSIYKGIFDKENIEIEKVTASGNQPEILLGGGADVYLGTVPVMLAPYMNGADLKWIGSVFKPSTYYGVSRFKKDEFSKIKNVGVTTLSPTSRIFTSDALRNMGLSIDNMKLAALSSNQAKMAALENNGIDFTLISSFSPLEGNRIREKYAIIPPQEVLSGSQIFWSVVATNEKIEKSKESLKSFLTGLKGSREYFVSHRDEAIQYLLSKGYSSSRAEALYEGMVRSMNGDMVPKKELISDLYDLTATFAKIDSPREIGGFVYSELAE